MKALERKKMLRQKRVWRIRKKVTGTAERPRLCVNFSNKHIYAQAINDEAGTTVVGLSTMSKGLDEKLNANTTSAKTLGAKFGEALKNANVQAVVFDRHGRPYHGRVKEFADAVRESGIQF
ncbi:MAG: large subunit ribosomal protein L18 [Puniceicoccaceae bacterium 5H]|nr:MAG: large subunit ribosomal protein L18 [Puniceicoccaceae bacterium 5H]